MNSRVTAAARAKLARARTGEAVLPKVAGMAFGDGALDEQGEVKTPIGEGLYHEIYRKVIDGYEAVSETCYRYSCTLQEKELTGKALNEIALYDADGDIILMKSFTSKGKDEDMQMVFSIDDQF